MFKTGEIANGEFLLTVTSERDIRTGEANVSLPRKVGSTPELSPKEKRKVRLEIANPLPGGHTSISLYHAERYIKRGDAILDVRGRLEFRLRSVDAEVSAELRLRHRTGRGYDLATAIGLATRKELKHIPIVCPDKVLNCGRKRHKSGGQAGE